MQSIDLLPQEIVHGKKKKRKEKKRKKETLKLWPLSVIHYVKGNVFGGSEACSRWLWVLCILLQQHAYPEG